MKDRHAVAWPAVFLMAGCLVVQSCVINRQYPKQWAARDKEATQDCWAIAGAYYDEGETGDKKPDKASLSALIFPALSIIPAEPTDAGGAIVVKFAELPDDVLEISVWKDTQRLHVRALSRRRKEFECSSKGVQISTGTSGGGTSGAVGVAWNHVNLSVNKEGSLVVETVGSGFAVFPIPVIGGENRWAIFKRVATKG